VILGISILISSTYVGTGIVDTGTVDTGTPPLPVVEHCGAVSVDETWDSSRGVHLGWQVFDPETGLFISEGKWTPLENPLAPGQIAEQRVEVVLPPERGRYYVYVSPVEEDKGWSYAGGSPFLLIEAAVENGRAEFIEATSATVKSLRRRKRLRSLHRLFVDPVRTVLENHNLIEEIGQHTCRQ